jgi:hypothetical protein
MRVYVLGSSIWSVCARRGEADGGFCATGEPVGVILNVGAWSEQAMQQTWEEAQRMRRAPVDVWRISDLTEGVVYHKLCHSREEASWWIWLAGACLFVGIGILAFFLHTPSLARGFPVASLKRIERIVESPFALHGPNKARDIFIGRMDANERRLLAFDFYAAVAVVLAFFVLGECGRLLYRSYHGRMLLYRRLPAATSIAQRCVLTLHAFLRLAFVSLSLHKDKLVAQALLPLLAWTMGWHDTFSADSTTEFEAMPAPATARGSRSGGGNGGKKDS